MLYVGGDEGAGIFQSGSARQHGAEGGYGGEISGAVPQGSGQAAAGRELDVVYALEGCREIDCRVGWALAGDSDDPQSDGCGLFAAWTVAVELQRTSGGS